MFDLIILISLIVLGYIVGSRIESKHYRSISAREDNTYKQVCLSDKKCPKDLDIQESRLATGSVVIAIDHFKRILFSFRNLFGGEAKSYSSLIDRARREALLRMKETEPTADLFVNVRLETFSISKGAQGQVSAVEMFAYGTAIWLNK
jgi:uncharacterized protein YbjQ (UPF0145 family)